MNLGFPFSFVQLLVIGPGYLLRGAEKLQIKVGHGARERASTRATENARARALQRTRERAAKNRPLRRREACVATVSNRVLARKLERRQTKKLEGRGGGEKREVSFSPLHLPVHSSFLLSSQRSRRSRAETLATRRLERSDFPQMLAGYAFLNKARRCNKYTNKLVIFDARSMFATDGNMLKRFAAHLCYGSLKVRWME